MKKISFIAVLLCLLLCSCGVLIDTDTPKSSELSEKYSFYENSVAAIRSGCNVSPEEADEIFLVLVNDCGVDKEITVTPYVNAPYSVKYGSKTLSMTLDSKSISEVFDGESRIYPAAAAGASIPEESSIPEETETPSDNTPEVPHRSGDEIVGVSDKDVSEIHMNFAGKVKNDVTENWRYSTTSEDIDIENYALSYYETYFESDNEIHGIINFTRNTTARLNVSGGMIYLSLYDYVDGEEHDAKIMFSGTPLANYIIYADNGDIEKTE